MISLAFTAHVGDYSINIGTLLDNTILCGQSSFLLYKDIKASSRKACNVYYKKARSVYYKNLPFLCNGFIGGGAGGGGGGTTSG